MMPSAGEDASAPSRKTMVRLVPMPCSVANTLDPANGGFATLTMRGALGSGEGGATTMIDV